MTTTKDVTDFISGFLNVQNSNVIVDAFMNGRCYWFAKILSSRFHGDTYYNPVENHFVSAIYVDDRVERAAFDITGERYVELRDIQDFEGGVSAYYWWIHYQAFEPLDAKRVRKYCIEFKGGE